MFMIFLELINFWDETHIGYDGAKVFTKIIRERLKEK
jgi:hypothetical protein